MLYNTRTITKLLLYSYTVIDKMGSTAIACRAYHNVPCILAQKWYRMHWLNLTLQFIMFVSIFLTICARFVHVIDCSTHTLFCLSNFCNITHWVVPAGVFYAKAIWLNT